MGPPGEESLQFIIYNLQLMVSYLYLGGFEGNWLITCRFSAFFLVVSIKKRTFAEKFNVYNYRLWQH